MSTALVCPKCGLANPIGASFCSRCSERLTTTEQAQAVPGTQVGPPRQWQVWQPKQYLPADRQAIDRTQTGLLLLIIGLLLAPIPYVNYVGGILAIVGAILVILGREVFGLRHSRFVIASLIIYLIGLGIVFINAFGFGFSLATAAFSNPNSIGQAVIDAFNQFLIVLVIGGAVTGIAVLLFTYALQNSTGRILLWTGFASNLAVGILIFYIISGEVTSELQPGTSSGTSVISILLALQGQIQVLSLLNLVPAVMSATAFYLVRSRINHGELPQAPGPAPPFQARPLTP